MTDTAGPRTFSRSSWTVVPPATAFRRQRGSGGGRCAPAALLAWLLFPPAWEHRPHVCPCCLITGVGRPPSPHEGSGGGGRWQHGPARPPSSRTAGDGDERGMEHACLEAGQPLPQGDPTWAGRAQNPSGPFAAPGTQVKFTQGPEKPNMHHETQDFALSWEKGKS